MTDAAANATKPFPIHQSCSLERQVAALEVGESAAVARRLDLDSVDKAQLRDAIERLRGKANPCVTRAKAKNPGAEYSVEGGEFRTKGYDLMVVVAITRTK